MSTRLFPADIVATAARLHIIRLREEREKEQEALIQRTMKENKKYILFGRHLNRDEAIRLATTPERNMSPWSFIEARYKSKIADLVVLLGFADSKLASNEFINLDDEGFAMVGDYLNRAKNGPSA